MSVQYKTDKNNKYELTWEQVKQLNFSTTLSPVSV